MKNQQIRFCVSCHKRIPNDAIFCPYCGVKQTAALKKEKFVPNKISRAKQPQAKIDIHVEPPINAHQLNSDLKMNHIVEYKNKMGMSDKTDNFLYLSNSYYRRKPLFGKLGLIQDKNILIDFEKDGLLFIGYNLWGHFSGHNAFIVNKQIRGIHFHISRLQNLILIELKYTNLEFPISKILFKQKWQDHNLAILSKRYS